MSEDSHADFFVKSHVRILGEVRYTPQFGKESSMEQGLDFGRALEKLKDGELVTRAGWNGKGMFLYLVQASTFQVNRPPLLGIFPEGKEINYQAHIDMKTANGSCVPWLASQSDILANDWMVTTA